ncbi:hypothetical protein [uncultured Maribacter sp.]|uniref:hypothetical protein n=1 Tax=uncultured Maribacter sp. TaxID=431308 RepID=UPI002617ADF8|nr:hypothetical protein [uncultured Maribacter sp.]
MMFKKPKLGKYFFEFTSMFLAVISAFALNNWNDNRRDALAEEKVLLEINNGLKLDLVDIKANITGHKVAKDAIIYFKKILNNVPVSQDSLMEHHFYLTGDNNSVMNVSGYESLKSKGLEIIKNDSIRSQIITLYENNYVILKNYEENSIMNQSFVNYYFPIENILANSFSYDENGNLKNIQLPLKLTLKEKNLLHSYLFRMNNSRNNKLYEYRLVEKKVIKLQKQIEKELVKRW